MTLISAYRFFLALAGQLSGTWAQPANVQDVFASLGAFAAGAEGAEREALAAAAELLAGLASRRAARSAGAGPPREKVLPESTFGASDAPPESEKPTFQQTPPRGKDCVGKACGNEQNASSAPEPDKDARASNELPPRFTKAPPPLRDGDTHSEGLRGGGRDPDPFADLLRGFGSRPEELRAAREKAREDLSEAEKAQKEATRLVVDLERQLREARANATRWEAEVKARKTAKREAERAVLRAYTDIAESVAHAAEQALGALRGGRADGAAKEADSGRTRIEPSPFAEAVLWGARHYKGDAHKLRCCDFYDLSQLRSPVTVRSITLPKGVRAVLYPSGGSGLDQTGRIKGPDSVEIFGSVSEVDGLIDFSRSCCQGIQLLPGVEHNIDESVMLYEKEGYEGEAFAYRPGDHELDRPRKIASVRVPAGLQVTLYAAPLLGEGSFVGFLKHDTAIFPQEETYVKQQSSLRVPVASLRVRQIKESDLHGIFVFPEPSFGGRSQFFPSGKHYIYPETWPEVKSAKPTGRTFARFFTDQGLLTVREDSPSVEEKYIRPRALEVSSVCEPLDFCGEHGRCVAPQRCECSGSFQGESCHLQVPDESSAIVCDRNSVVVGETLPCRLLPRRYNLAANATSLFLQVKLAGDARACGLLAGSPVVALERRLAGPAQERRAFAFDAVFNATGAFAAPFDFFIFGRPQGGVFAPQIQVLQRCDLPGTSAKVQCDATSPTDSVALCSVSLHRSAPLECPRGALRVLLLLGGTRPAEVLAVVADSEVAPDRLNFTLDQRQLLTADSGKLRFAVEVRHGPAWTAPTLRLEVEAQVGSMRRQTTTLPTAEGLLRAGLVDQAVDVLGACADMDKACAALRAAMLSSRLQMSRNALEASDFAAALEAARQARRLGGSGAALAALGHAFLALGHGDAARHNFRGCDELDGTGAGAQCRTLADAVVQLQADAAALANGSSWAEAEALAMKLLHDHGTTWPAFASNVWGLEANMVICMARHAVNVTDVDAAVKPCADVAAAPAAMRQLLDAQKLLRCHVALAEALERARSLEAALAAAEAAESLLEDSELDDMAAVVRLLRERLARAARQENEKAGGAGNSSSAKAKRPEPTDYYAVLGLAKNATAAEIKRAYRQMALKYHPDKNSDPEAVDIFLDVQKAYQVLSDESLRRKHDAGDKNVGEEAGTQNMKPMQFRVLERDHKRGIAKVWWHDPNTGEEGIMEMEIETEEEVSSSSVTLQLYAHCCLPEARAAAAA